MSMSNNNGTGFNTPKVELRVGDRLDVINAEIERFSDTVETQDETIREWVTETELSESELKTLSQILMIPCSNKPALRMYLIKAEIARLYKSVLTGDVGEVWITEEILTDEELSFLANKIEMPSKNPDPAQEILNNF